MRAVVTGGAGFLGRLLVDRLLGDERWASVAVADRAAPPTGWATASDRMEVTVGDVTEPAVLDTVIADDTDVVFHLASVVSAGAEDDFDLGYAVNLHGTVALLERCRRLRRPPMVVFASSVAVFGRGAGPVVDERSTLRPETSYGVQKAIGELLVNDYTRKGFLDGRALRLPTVVVRPGPANRAASGFASAIVREPLAGRDTVCPVRPDTVLAVISPRRVVDALVRIVDVPGDRLGADRTVLLPGLPMRVEEAVAVVADLAGDRPLGRVDYRPDPGIQAIIDAWPPSIVSHRAEALGLAGDTSVAAIVRQHIEDHLDVPDQEG